MITSSCLVIMVWAIVLTTVAPNDLARYGLILVSSVAAAVVGYRIDKERK